MKEYIGIQKAVDIINRTFNSNIDPRGNLRPYERVCKDLKLRWLFTEQELLDAIYNYKQSNLYKLVYENNNITGNRRAI